MGSIIPKLRLKAKKKSKYLNDLYLENGCALNVHVEVEISMDQDEIIQYRNEAQLIRYTYSRSFLDQLNSFTDLFHVFSRIFFFVDDSGLITLLNKESELTVFERISIKSKNEYYNGEVFLRKNFLLLSQILIYDHYLKAKNKSIEIIIEGYINEFLNINSGISKFKFKFSTENSSYLEKIRMLAPEFEFLLKQYKNFVDDGNIDYELLELNSTQLNFGEIISLSNKKYVYSNSNTISQLKYTFFSDQSSLYYIKKFENKYANLYDLLINENIELSDFKNFQEQVIQKLIDDDYLYVNSMNFVKIKEEIMIYLVSKLFYDEVVSYWHYPKDVRVVIDGMVSEGLLYFENKLFTKQELNYFNFYLNKKQFTNGPDLRNKYLHGSNADLEQIHKNEYYILLRLVVLAILKIEDDLVIKYYFG